MNFWPIHIPIPTFKQACFSLGSSIIGWYANSVWDWWKHCFWTGFKASFLACVRLGRGLTPEELKAIQVKVNEDLKAEFAAKLKPIQDYVDACEAGEKADRDSTPR